MNALSYLVRMKRWNRQDFELSLPERHRLVPYMIERTEIPLQENTQRRKELDRKNRREKDRERKKRRRDAKSERGGEGGRKKVEREERKGEGDEESERNDNFIKANKQRKKWATEKVNRMKTRDLLYLSYTFLSFYI